MDLRPQLELAEHSALTQPNRSNEMRRIFETCILKNVPLGRCATPGLAGLHSANGAYIRQSIILIDATYRT